MSKVEIFEPAMCCSTGVCGPGVDPELLRVSTFLNELEGEGRKIGIPYSSNPATCPIRSLQEWLGKSGITDGPVFRPVNRHGKVASIRLSAAAVAGLVKKYAELIGLNPTEFAGHSLRSGLATSTG